MVAGGLWLLFTAILEQKEPEFLDFVSQNKNTLNVIADSILNNGAVDDTAIKKLSILKIKKDGVGNVLFLLSSTNFSENGVYRYGGKIHPKNGFDEPTIVKREQLKDDWFYYAAD